ncbi:hypothetical protein D3C77_582900 [compost metagenome]
MVPHRYGAENLRPGSKLGSRNAGLTYWKLGRAEASISSSRSWLIRVRMIDCDGTITSYAAPPACNLASRVSLLS